MVPPQPRLNTDKSHSHQSSSGFLPWDRCLDGLGSPCDLTVIFSSLCDVGSDNNHQIPGKTDLIRYHWAIYMTVIQLNIRLRPKRHLSQH